MLHIGRKYRSDHLFVGIKVITSESRNLDDLEIR